jgi:hypothetical protein
MVWSENWGKMFKPQTITLKTERTPFQIVKDALNSCLMVLGSLLAVIVSFLFFIDRLDLLAQFLEVLFRKLIRVIQVVLE